MSIRRRSTLGLAFLLAATTALAGCSSSSDSGGETTPSGEASRSSLTIASYEPDHLTPGNTLLAYLPAQALFSPLTFADAEGNLTMVAAESVTSEDATTWTIKLKSGWTFHDGTPVTAKDYVDSWNAVAYGPNAWAGNGSMSGIAGYADLNPASGEPTTKEMSGLKVVDDLTFTVTLTAPDGQFPVQLSQNMPAFYPMPAAAFEDPEAFDRNPVGNGPFKMAAPWKATESITLTAYDKFAGEKPGTDEFILKPYLDLGTAYTDAQAGNIDIVSVAPDKLVVAETDFPGRVRTSDAPGGSYLAFPESDPRFADVRVRQAFSMAIDRAAVNKVAYAGTYKESTAWTSQVEPGTPVGICGEFCEFDPAAAKALLDEAGGFSGTVELVTIPGMNVEWEAYANQLRQNLGLEDVVVSPMTDAAAFLGARAAGELTGPYMSGWVPPYPSQQNMLRNVFTPTGLCAGCSQWLDPEVEAAIAAADAQVDPAKAQAGYAEAQQLIADNFPVAPLLNTTSVYVVSDKVEDLAMSAGYLVLPKVKAAS